MVVLTSLWPDSARRCVETATLRSTASQERKASTAKANEHAHPMDVGLLGTYAVVKVVNPLTHLAQQTGRLQRGQGQLRGWHAAQQH
jgi:hypothetical protein